MPEGGRLAPVVIRLPAEVDMVNSGAVGGGLRAALTPGVRLVIADMSQTVFCDSSGLRQLGLAHRAAADLDIRLCLAACAPAVQRVMTLTGLARLIQVYPSVPDALTSYGPPAG